jgi:glycine cleavage system H lipoate-binding protein
MTQKTYKTAQGKIVDMGRLVLQNEQVRAVGNMNVNARGDVVDDMNRPISSKTQQVNRQYQNQTTQKK